MPKPGCVSSLVGPCLGQAVMRFLTSRRRKLQVAGLAPCAGIQVFSLNPKHNDLFSAPPRLTWVSGEASHPEVLISQLGLPGRCWSRTEVGKSQQCIRERGCECPNLTLDFRLWSPRVTPLPGFSCVSGQDAVVSVLSRVCAFRSSCREQSGFSHSLQSSGPVRTAFCHSQFSRQWSELHDLFSL